MAEEESKYPPTYRGIVQPKNYDCKCNEKPCTCEKNEWADILKRAWDTRTFEIETSWKRTNYFSIVVGALFIGYYTIASKSNIGYLPNNDPSFFVTILITLLGFIASLTWFFINKGSKFWQEHWESNIDEIENAMQHNQVHSNVFTKNKYSVLYPTKTYPFSVSKLNMIFSGIVTISWGGLFIYEFVKKFNMHILTCGIDTLESILKNDVMWLGNIVYFIIPIIILIIIILFIWRKGRSQYKEEPTLIEGGKHYYYPPQNDKKKKNCFCTIAFFIIMLILLVAFFIEVSRCMTSP